MAKTNTGNKGNELLEDPNSLADKLSQSEDFVKKNRNMLLYIGVAVVVVAGGLFFYWTQLKEQNQEAQVSMINGVYFWEQDSTKQALKDLVDIADQNGMTDAGNLAKFYVGTAYLKQGKFEEAITSLKEFNSNDLLLQARVYSLIGDAYMEQKDLENAVSFYNKAVDYKPNQYYTPEYCMKAGLAYELDKKYEEAVKMYDKVIKEFWQASEVNDAKKYKARAEELMVAEK